VDAAALPQSTDFSREFTPGDPAPAADELALVPALPAEPAPPAPALIVTLLIVRAVPELRTMTP
jgi:hypothetical protein